MTPDVLSTQLQAVFGQPGLHGLHELLRLVALQAQQLGRQHHHLVHADLPVAGRDPGLCPGLPRGVRGQRPGAAVGPALGLGPQTLVGEQGVRALVSGVAQARHRLQACEQLAQMRQRLAVGQVLGPVAAGGKGQDQVHRLETGVGRRPARTGPIVRDATMAPMRTSLMQMPYELLLGWRYTRAGRASRRNGFISFISGVSMLGIALGVAALIIVLSVMNGFQREVRDRMLGVVSQDRKSVV